MNEFAFGTPLIETIDLKKHFKVTGGMLQAVDGINMKIFKGTTMGVVGESGCGKSTLGRTVLRLTEPTAGQILFEGNDIRRYKKRQMQDLRKKMQIIFQDPYSSINPRMTVEEIIAEFMIVNKSFGGNKSKIWAQTHRLMETVGLAKRLATAYPHELDGGRRQRVGIARALSLDAKFIVCDEPVSALDVSIQAQILNLLMDLQDEFKLTYMFITHDLSVVKHISNEISVMYLGKCVERAPSDELFQNPLHPYTKALIQAIPVPKIEMRDQEILPIKGEVQSPINLPPGCRFAGRCNYASDSCRNTTPELKEYKREHFVACTLIENSSI